jgi:excisionase family DNA binding protein
MSLIYKTFDPLDSFFYTRKEAAERAGISLSTFDRLVDEGGVPKKLIRGKYKFPKNAFDLWCNQPDAEVPVPMTTVATQDVKGRIRISVTLPSGQRTSFPLTKFGITKLSEAENLASKIQELIQRSLEGGSNECSCN